MNHKTSETQPLKYSDILINVGSNHCYQYCLMVTYLFAGAILSVAVSSLTYIFMNFKFDCQELGIEVSDC